MVDRESIEKYYSKLLNTEFLFKTDEITVYHNKISDSYIIIYGDRVVITNGTVIYYKDYSIIDYGIQSYLVNDSNGELLNSIIHENDVIEELSFLAGQGIKVDIFLKIEKST